jgi:hypothetical protein
MTSPFDPRSWLPGARPPAGDERADSSSWLDPWMDLTTWWVKPMAAATDAMRPENLLVQLIDGIASRFAGQRIELRIRGRKVPARLDSLRLVRRDDRNEVRVDLRELAVAGVPLDEVDAVARAVTITPGTTLTVVARGIEAIGRAPLVPVVRWLDEQVDAWSLSVDDASHILARHVARGVVVVVEPSVDAGAGHLELREVRYGNARVPIPRWLRLERSFPVALEGGWSVSEARRAGSTVQFRLACDELVHELQPATVRDAIARGDALDL